MKPLFILLIILNFSDSFAQNFTIPELHSLQKMTYGEMESYLYKKGYSYTDSKKERTGDSGIQTTLFFHTNSSKTMFSKFSSKNFWVDYQGTMDRSKYSTDNVMEYSFNDQVEFEDYKKYLLENEFLEDLTLPGIEGILTTYIKKNDIIDANTNFYVSTVSAKAGSSYRYKISLGYQYSNYDK